MVASLILTILFKPNNQLIIVCEPNWQTFKLNSYDFPIFYTNLTHFLSQINLKSLSESKWHVLKPN